MQPTPKPNNTQPIHEQVIEDIKRRAEEGKQNYGTYLQVNNGRDPLLDAYEEAQDKALYLKQAILERDDLIKELELAREELREVQSGAALQARDRRMKLIGAAEELEKAATEEWEAASYGGNPILIVGRLQQRAAKLRKEAEGK